MGPRPLLHAAHPSRSTEAKWAQILYTEIKAVAVLEHAMLVAIWTMLSAGAAYEDLGSDFYLRRAPDRSKSHALKHLRDMSYEVTLEPVAM